MAKFKVPITDYVAPPALFEEEVLSDIADVVCLQLIGESALQGKVEDADALLVFHTVSFSRDSIRRLKKCRGIVRCGVGYDNVDLEAAGEKGIYVCNVPDYGVDEVADHAMALMLACARGLRFTEKRLQKTLAPLGHPRPSTPSSPGRRHLWHHWARKDRNCHGHAGQGLQDEGGRL